MKKFYRNNREQEIQREELEREWHDEELLKQWDEQEHNPERIKRIKNP